MTYAYIVRCEFADPTVGEAWAAWLRDEHLADVCNAGALDAEVIRVDTEPTCYEVRYHFASRDAFATYERDHAPRLREEGLKRFPPERGVTYTRTTGEVVAAR